MLKASKMSRVCAVIFMIAAVAAVGVGCGDSDSGPMEPGPQPQPPLLGDFPAGVYTTDVPVGAAPFALLEGHWTLEIQADGDFLITHAAGSVAGEVTVAGSQITLKDLGGALACLSPTNIATYAWSETATTVAFSVVSDGCDGRRFVMSYAPWTR